MSQPPDPKFTAATTLLQQQRYSEAIEILTALTAARPTEGEYWFALGIAHAANNQPQQAIEPLSRACQSSPKPPRACYNLGRVHQQLNQHELALAAFGTAEDSQSHTAKAQSYEALGRKREADIAYRAALAESALRPKNSAAIQLRYSQFLIQSGNPEAALWQLNQAIRKQPFEGLAWLEKTRALLELRRAAEAADALEQAIAHGQRNRENLMLLSRIYESLGDNEKARSYREEAR